MCRFVSVFIFVTFVSCVSAEDVPATTEHPLRKCGKKPEVKNSQQAVRKCFNETVQHHLYGHVTGGCKNAADLEEPFKNYWTTVQHTCNTTISFNITNITKIIDYSLNNISFENFYKGKDCLIKAEKNISNICVKGNVGFFNISETKKHSSWRDKTILKYSDVTCATNKKVEECVQGYLKNCPNDTMEYVSKLFKYVRDFGNCSQFSDSAVNKTSTTSGLSLLAIIAIVIGAVVLVAAIITIIILKRKK